MMEKKREKIIGCIVIYINSKSLKKESDRRNKDRKIRNNRDRRNIIKNKRGF